MLRCNMIGEFHRRATQLPGRALTAAALCFIAVGCGQPRRGGRQALLVDSASRPPTDLVYSRAIGPGKRALCVASSNGRPERRLTDGTADDGVPRWTPDGRAVIFSSKRIGTWQLWQVPAEGGRPTRLRTNVSRGHRGSTSRLIETDLASGAEKAVVDWPALNYDPVYSPDGTELAFASNMTGEYQIYRVRVSDGKPYRVTSGPGESREPDYRPRR
jgi:Tol biopolymer transport system component